MKALVIGAGGGEHALAWKLAQSPAVTAQYTAPGNYGSNLVGGNMYIPLTEPEELAAWAKETGVDLTVVGSRTALAYGVVDAFRAQGLRIIGPTQAAARLETDRTWARGFMDRHEIPGPSYQPFSELREALQYLRTLAADAFPLLVKADNLGDDADLTLAPDREAAEEAVGRCLAPVRRGPAPRVLLEEYLEGPSLTFLALTDGITTQALTGAREYRQAEENSKGAITGGMGANSPAAELDAALQDRIMDRIVHPVLRGMAAEGLPYTGILAADLVLTVSGPRVVAFATRFTDPATQVILPRWEDDLYVVLDAVADTELAELGPLRWSGDVACAVVLTSEGYPGEFETGYGILGLGDVGSGSLVFHNNTRDPYNKGTELLAPKIEPTRNRVSRGMGLGGWLMPSRDRSKRLDRQATHVSRDPYSQVVTAGGRVLTVVGRGRTLEDASNAAYRAADSIAYTGCRYRADIGALTPSASS